MNTDFIIDSDDEAISDNEDSQEVSSHIMNQSEAEILMNLGLDPKIVRIEDLNEDDLLEMEDMLSDLDIHEDHNDLESLP